MFKNLKHWQFPIGAVCGAVLCLFVVEIATSRKEKRGGTELLAFTVVDEETSDPLKKAMFT
jgi:hypothetical protein